MSVAHHRVHAILLAVVLSVASVAAYAQTRMAFDLPAQPLARALLAVGSRAGVNVTFDPKVVRGFHAAALKGSYTVRQALERLLRRSGLVVQTTRNGSFLIVREDAAHASSSSAPFQSSTYTFHLPAQSLVATLRAIRKRTGRQIELDPEARSVVGKSVTVAVDGTMTPLQAVREALADTGMQVETSPKGVLTVRSVVPPGKGDDVRTMRRIVSTAMVSGLSATRTATPLLEIPQSVSVFGQNRIRTQNLSNLNDVLNQATGVTVVQSNMLNSDFYSRGFWINSYHVDGGAPISFVSQNGISPDMSEYNHVVVLRGADALFGGAGSPGATLDLSRKRPQSKPAVILDQLVGSWRTFRTQLDATGPIGLDGKLLGRIVAVYDHRHFYYDTASMRRRKLYGIVEYHPASSTTLTVGGSADFRNDVPMTTGLPRYLDGGDIHLPRSTFFGMPWQRERATSHEVFAKLSHSFSERWKMKIQATRNKVSSDQFAASLNGPVQRGTGRLLGAMEAQSNVFSTKSISANAQLSGGFSVHGWAQDVLIGADYEDNESSVLQKYYPIAGPPVSVFDIENYPALPQEEFSSTTPLKLKQYGLYAAIRVRALVDGLSFSAGIRKSNYKRKGTTTILAPDGSLIFQTPSRNSLVHGKPTPLLGVNYDLGKHYSLYASYADIYGPPSPNLRKADGSPFDAPQDGVNLEAGIKGEWHGGLLNGSVALFKIRQSGVPLQGSSNPSIPGCCFVGGKNVSHGFELALNGRLARGLQVGIGYTFNVNHQATLPGNEATPLQTQTPKHLFKLWTNYRLSGNWSHWSVGGDLHAQSESYENGLVCDGVSDALGHCLGSMTDYHVTQGFYAVLGMRLGYQLSSRWQLAVNVNNVFDRVYYRTTGNPISGSWYGEPRNVMVTLHGKL